MKHSVYRNMSHAVCYSMGQIITASIKTAHLQVFQRNVNECVSDGDQVVYMFHLLPFRFRFMSTRAANDCLIA